MIQSLTPRELQVLNEIAHGHTAREIAGRLVMSHHMACHHVKSIHHKLNVKTNSGAVARGFELHLLRLVEEGNE